MKNPLDYNKAVYTCMAIVQASYLTFSLIVYKWCGKWVANPSLGSAGETVKKVTFGIGLIGLIVSACLYLVCFFGSEVKGFFANACRSTLGQSMSLFGFFGTLNIFNRYGKITEAQSECMLIFWKNTMVHWVTWISCTTILGALAFILAEAIPIFNYIIALVGSLCFAPLAIVSTPPPHPQSKSKH